MKLAILGYGRSGKAAEALARALGHETVVLTDETDDVAAALSDVARAIVSPGFALTHPLLAACRAQSIPLASEMQFGCEALVSRGVKLFAVTGSKGKSSVVKLVAEGLTRAGRPAVACGNYGLPVSDVACAVLQQSPSAPRFAIVEVSSFMMETTDLPADAFEAAAVLNLQEDHLDRHGSVAAYRALKMKLLSSAKAGRAPCAAEGESSALMAGSYFDNGVLRENGAAGVWLMRRAGLADTEIREAFASFEPLPHRMNLVAELDGVRYIDDSKATSLAALAAGVRMTSGAIRLIAGGLPKGDDPKSVLGDLTARVKKVYLIGRSAELFASAWSSAVDCEICGTMERAVAAAKCDAEKGESVLLSPGTASFDQFKSFGERGEVFAQLVQKERR